MSKTEEKHLQEMAEDLFENEINCINGMKMNYEQTKIMNS